MLLGSLAWETVNNCLILLFPSLFMVLQPLISDPQRSLSFQKENPKPFSLLSRGSLPQPTFNAGRPRCPSAVLPQKAEFEALPSRGLTGMVQALSMT